MYKQKMEKMTAQASITSCYLAARVKTTEKSWTGTIVNGRGRHSIEHRSQCGQTKGNFRLVFL